MKLVLAGGPRGTTRAAVDEFGAFNGTLKVPADLGTGVLRIEADLDTQPHQGEARVQDYVKPTFYVELQPASETVVPGQTVKVTVRRAATRAALPRARSTRCSSTAALLDAPAWVDDCGQGRAGQRGDVRHRLHQRGQAQRAGAAVLLRRGARGRRRTRGPAPASSTRTARRRWRSPCPRSSRARSGCRTATRSPCARGMIRRRSPTRTAAFFLSKVEVLGVARYSDAVVQKGSRGARCPSAPPRCPASPTASRTGEVEFVLRKRGRQREAAGQAGLHHARGRHVARRRCPPPTWARCWRA